MSAIMISAFESKPPNATVIATHIMQNNSIAMKTIKRFCGSAFLYRPERAKAVMAFLSYMQFTVMFMLLRSAVIDLSFIYRLYDIMIQYFAACVK